MWSLPPARYQIVAACFLATLCMYVERVGFSIAFTSMASETSLDESAKGTVLSAFYWGYALSQVPGGWTAQLYGGRLMLTISFVLWSTASMLTPTVASKTAQIMAARVCVGIAQGFLIPSIHTVLSQWIPAKERARAVSLATSGMYLGSALAMLVLPSIAVQYGASMLLKVDGGLGYAWLGLWMVVGREVPHRDTLIPLTITEQAGGRPAAPTKGRPAPTPWGRLLRSPAMAAIIFNNFSFHYAFYVVMNWLPTYFTSVLHVDLASVGWLKTLPYLTMFFMSNVGGWGGDWLILSRKFPVARARKTINMLGFVGAAVSLMVMPSAKGVVSGITATTMTLGALGFARGGFSVNHMDIAPKYAGVVMGVSNTAGTLAGVVGVALTGVILDFEGGAANIQGWYHAHAVAATACLMAMTIFNIFARGETLFP